MGSEEAGHPDDSRCMFLKDPYSTVDDYYEDKALITTPPKAGAGLVMPPSDMMDGPLYWVTFAQLEAEGFLLILYNHGYAAKFAYWR